MNGTLIRRCVAGPRQYLPTKELHEDGGTMTHVDDRTAAKETTHWSEPMERPKRTIGQKISQAAQAIERLQTKCGRKWVAVFMNEDTIVIALHGSLTLQEKALAQSPAGAAQVRQLFANASGILLRKIKSITGMEVRNTTVEIEPKTGSVVQLFTTDTAGGDFPISPGELASAMELGQISR